MIDRAERNRGMTRQEAIEVLKHTIAYESNFAEAKQMAIKALEKELSVIPKPKEGEWIEKDFAIVCSECGGREDTFIHGYGEWETCGESDYCPNCGAKMKEVEE